MIKSVFVGITIICAFVSGSLAQTTKPAETAPFTHTSSATFSAMQWDLAQQDRPLDLSKCKETFRDDFTTMTIGVEDGPGPWYSPGHAPFGASDFPPPKGEKNPFRLVADGLQIRATKDAKKWHAGIAQTVNKKGEGFSQQYGYFEMTAKFPDGKGAWPAFWLLSRDQYIDGTKTRTEIDVIEWYGGDPKGHHTTVHLWPAKSPQPGAVIKPIHNGKYFNMDKAGLLTNKKWEGFHTYGAEITPEWVIIYLDRKELERFPTVPEFRTPLYMLIDLAINDKEVAQAVSPMDMVIKNVTAYQLK